MELRRQRDAIRHEMEQLVRTMQRLEPEVEQKRPGWEAKREELSQYRARLSELRARMRAVMDAAANANTTTTTSSSAISPAPAVTQVSGRQLFPSSTATPPQNAQQLSPKRQASPSQGSTSYRHTSHGSAHQLHELAQLHKSEKQRLAEECARAMEALDRRHAQETAELEARLQAEEQHLREYELARQRMEEAQRHLEQLKRTPSVLSHRPAMPELDLLRR